MNSRTFPWSNNTLIIALLALLYAAQRADAACSAADQRGALQRFYNDTNGPGWLMKDGWTNSSSANCTQTLTTHNGKKAGNVSVPAHCCWHGVQCCLVLGHNSSLTQCANSQCSCVAVGLVSNINLGQNKLSGNLPTALNSTFTEAMGCSLRRLHLGVNQLDGSVPDSLADLRALEEFQVGVNGEAHA